MSKNKTTFLIIAVTVGVLLAVKFLFFSTMDVSDIERSKTKGPDNAAIKIVEFIDFQCPACAHGAIFLKTFMDENPGKVQLTLKHFPLGMHNHALVAALHVQCAGAQGKFFEYHDLLVDNQQKWAMLSQPQSAFDLFSDQLEIDKEQMASCVTDQNILEVIFNDKEEGRRLNIRSTPTYFINGEMVVGKPALQAKLNQLIHAK